REYQSMRERYVRGARIVDRDAARVAP
ncbi:MAG: hypothetical protein QOC64_1317, partial [Solirubrobacteraceae bacterium]|nr:hypothetical protein [Solirubrobacteraceae bacterium]